MLLLTKQIRSPTDKCVISCCISIGFYWLVVDVGCRYIHTVRCCPRFLTLTDICQRPSLVVKTMNSAIFDPVPQWR